VWTLLADLGSVPPHVPLRASGDLLRPARLRVQPLQIGTNATVQRATNSNQAQELYHQL
jgi:hypothetical protein